MEAERLKHGREVREGPGLAKCGCGAEWGVGVNFCQPDIAC